MKLPSLSLLFVAISWAPFGSPFVPAVFSSVLRRSHLYTENDEGGRLVALHEEVAMEDPHWYEEFVLQLIGEDDEDIVRKAPTVNSIDDNSGADERQERSEGLPTGDGGGSDDGEPPRKDDELVVVYRDSTAGALRFAALTKFEDLGYSSEEVSSMQPDAICLIIEENLARPRRGIPTQWMMSRSQQKLLAEDVRIVHAQQTEKLLESFRKDVKRGQRNEARSVARPSGAGLKRQNAPQPKKKSPERKRTRDPPITDDSPWMDLATFRNLLRREAELRVRILGEDWTEDVKRESNWRLRLYEEWLWYLSSSDPETAPFPQQRIANEAKERRLRNEAAQGLKRRRPRRVLDPRRSSTRGGGINGHTDADSIGR